MTKPDYYEVLGVSKTASADEISRRNVRVTSACFGGMILRTSGVR